MDKPTILFVDKLNGMMFECVFCTNFLTSIRRTVINNNHFVKRHCLTEDRV